LRTPALDFKRTAFGATLLFALLTLSACASAPAPFDPLPLGRSVIAPTGFVQFCQRRPDQCAAVEPVTERSPPDVDDRLEPASMPTLLLPCEAGEVARRGGGVTEGACLTVIAANAPSTTLRVVPLPPCGGEETCRISQPRAEDLFAPRPPPADAWPQPRLTLLDYRPTATVARRDIAMDVRPWTAIEIRSPFDDQRPAKVYTVISRDALGARLHLSAGLQAEIATVDVAINRAITPRTDLEAFGVDNYWTLPLTDGPKPEGNCKHYVLEKRRQLVADGVPPDALSMAIVTTPANEVHAVLVVSTDQGDLVLDNLTDAIRPWRGTDYHWLVRQTPAAPLHWVEVG
jgi:predicted transglutaminase-like cysteine proteinase